MKKSVFFLTILILLTVLANNAEASVFIAPTYMWMSDFVFTNGVPFLSHNQAASMVGVLTLYNDTISVFPYYGWSSDYNEYGVFLWVYAKLGKNTKLGFFGYPFKWKFEGEESDKGLIYGLEISHTAMVNLRAGVWSSIFPNYPEWEGQFYYAGLSKELFWKIIIDGEIGYNNHMVTSESSPIAKLKLSRTFAWKSMSLELYSQKFWVKNKDMNPYNEFVIGITASYGFSF